MANVLEATSSLGSSSGFHALPTPSSMKPGRMQVVTQSQRTVGKGALLHKQLLGVKRKLSCTWSYLTPAQYKLLEDMHEYNFFQIKFNDPRNLDRMTTLTVYGGDLEGTAVRADPSSGHIVAYKDVSWNFIER